MLRIPLEQKELSPHTDLLMIRRHSFAAITRSCKLHLSIISLSNSSIYFASSACAKFSDRVPALIPAARITISLHPRLLASHLISRTLLTFPNREILQTERLPCEMNHWWSFSNGKSGCQDFCVAPKHVWLKAPSCERMMNTLVFRLRHLWYTMAVSGPPPAKSTSIRFDPFWCQNRLVPNHRLTIMYLQMFENSDCVKTVCLLRQVFAWLDISWTIFSPADICVSRPTNSMTHTIQVNKVQMCLNLFLQG